MEGVLLKYVGEIESKKILRDMHEDVCGGHYMDKTTTHKVHRTSFWWPKFSKMLMSLLKHVMFAKGLVES